MGGGISVISDNEHEMILKYSKDDANVDDIIEMIKNRKMHDSNNMNTYTANDTIDENGLINDANGINNVVTCSSNNGDGDGDGDDDNTSAAVVPSLQLAKSSASIIDQKSITAESAENKLNTSASEGILSSSLKQLPSAAIGRTTALRRPSSKSAPRGSLSTVASPRTSASSKGAKSPSVLTSPVARRGKYGRR